MSFTLSCQIPITISSKLKAIGCVHVIKMEKTFWTVVEKDLISIPDHIKKAFK